MKFKSTLFKLIIVTCFLGCATSSKNFNLNDVAPDEGVFVGKIKIAVDGKDLTDHCYVGFNGNNKPYINLDKTGLVIGKSKKGNTSLSFIICTDYGLISVNHDCHWKNSTFTNAGGNIRTY